MHHIAALNKTIEVLQRNLQLQNYRVKELLLFHIWWLENDTKLPTIHLVEPLRKSNFFFPFSVRRESKEEEGKLKCLLLGENTVVDAKPRQQHTIFFSREKKDNGGWLVWSFFPGKDLECTNHKELVTLGLLRQEIKMSPYGAKPRETVPMLSTLEACSSSRGY